MACTARRHSIKAYGKKKKLVAWNGPTTYSTHSNKRTAFSLHQPCFPSVLLLFSPSSTERANPIRRETVALRPLFILFHFLPVSEAVPPLAAKRHIIGSSLPSVCWLLRFSPVPAEFASTFLLVAFPRLNVFWRPPFPALCSAAIPAHPVHCRGKRATERGNKEKVGRKRMTTTMTVALAATRTL